MPPLLLPNRSGVNGNCLPQCHLILSISSFAEEADSYRNWLRFRVRNLLAAPHYLRAVKALAYVLLTNENVDYKQARIIIQKAIPVTIRDAL